MEKKRLYKIFKRIFDICFAIIGILFCLPTLWWWVTIINLFSSKGHPFFAQDRIGYKKKIFKLFKFRSMKLDVDSYMASSNVDKNNRNNLETRFGKFLRATSIDETLQFINILIGNMSFVGPRPGAAKREEELIKLRESYTPSAFDVKPGLTGLAQVKMHRRHSPEEKAKYDHEYVVNMNLWLDIKIIFKTIFGLFSSNKGE